ncbi:YciI family protein [Lysobacter sp. FW306-1B-D06B]|uniref:YciI family protein n=1 Tax=Lysobacter sp. FW306-1B-D06B TaxID=3140250 RepID=UPI003140675A
MKRWTHFLAVALLCGSAPLAAQEAPAAPSFDAALAKRLGADEHGMRRYVLVVLKTGPKRVPDGEQRKAMFAGHFANMERLSKEGKLAVAGPFVEDPAGWRGLFVFAVADVEEAKRLVATDPVIIQGEMVAEYHPWYSSAALMQIPQLHERLVAPAKP